MLHICKTMKLTGLLFLLDIGNNSFNLGKIKVLDKKMSGLGGTGGKKTHSNLSVALHDSDLNVFGARLNDFEQALYSKLDALVSR